MKLSSSVFKDNELIPAKYTCDGINVNPPLSITNIPQNTKSLALIMDDPDVPKEVRPEQMWDHWVLFNISPETTEIKENTNPGTPGKGSYPHTKYGGPCPPPQFKPTTHRYFFKLYALNKKLDLPKGATKLEVEKAMKEHILEKAELIGKYDRS